MLNNVLIALAGIEGESFHFDNTGPSKSALSVRYWDKCHPAEIRALERVTAPGALIHEINRFEYREGLYTDALKFSINGIMRDYYNDVALCEMDITNDRHEFYSLTHLETIFSKHQTRIEFLHLVITKVLDKRHGVEILDWLITSCPVGDPIVRDVVSILYSSLKSVFINQLQCWLNGQIYDPYKEFLIVPQENIGAELIYKIVESGLSFVSKDVLDMIYEIGRLVQKFTASYHELENWDAFIRNSISDLSYIESYEFEILMNKVQQRLSKQVAKFLIQSGIVKYFSVLRDTYLGGDIIISQEISQINETSMMEKSETNSCFEIPKELNLFFTLDDIQRYRRINSFLVKIKSCQKKVHGLFGLKKLNNQEIILKHKMSDFINSFWGFLQMNVIEIKYSELVASVDKLDYHQMLKSHHQYLQDIEHNIFLKNEPLLSKLHHIIDLMNDATTIMNGHHSLERTNHLKNSKDIFKLCKDFDHHVRWLIQVFKGIPSAYMLASCIDFNKWYAFAP